jgi:hypothetical protein
MTESSFTNIDKPVTFLLYNLKIKCQCFFKGCGYMYNLFQNSKPVLKNIIQSFLKILSFFLGGGGHAVHFLMLIKIVLILKSLVLTDPRVKNIKLAESLLQRTGTLLC